MHLTRFHVATDFTVGMFRAKWMEMDRFAGTVVERAYEREWIRAFDLPVPPAEVRDQGLCAWKPLGLQSFESTIRTMAAMREPDIIASTVPYDEVDILYEDDYQVVFKCRETKTSSESSEAESSTQLPRLSSKKSSPADPVPCKRSSLSMGGTFLKTRLLTTPVRRSKGLTTPGCSWLLRSKVSQQHPNTLRWKCCIKSC